MSRSTYFVSVLYRFVDNLARPLDAHGFAVRPKESEVLLDKDEADMKRFAARSERQGFAVTRLRISAPPGFSPEQAGGFALVLEFDAKAKLLVGSSALAREYVRGWHYAPSGESDRRGSRYTPYEIQSLFVPDVVSNTLRVASSVLGVEEEEKISEREGRKRKRTSPPVSPRLSRRRKNA
jgi:hypothetical protein